MISSEDRPACRRKRRKAVGGGASSRGWLAALRVLAVLISLICHWRDE